MPGLFVACRASAGTSRRPGGNVGIVGSRAPGPDPPPGPLTVAEMADAAGRDGHGGPEPAGAASGDGPGGAEGRARGARPAEASYQASVEAHKRLGQNYADLAVALWEEMMSTRGGSQAAPAPLHPDHRPPGGGLPHPGHRRRVGRAAGPAQPCPARPRGRGRGGAGRRRAGARSSASTRAPITSSPRPIAPSAPWSGRCSRRCSAGVCGSASAGSTATAPATSRPSRCL